GDPYAYVIPTDQHDPPTAETLVRILAMGAVEVSQAKAPFTAGGKQYAGGSFVVLMAQPNRGYAKDLLEPQHHPNGTNGPGGRPKRPYDMAGWTLPYQMGVRADAIKGAFAADLESVPDVRLKPDATGVDVRLKPDATGVDVRLKPDATGNSQTPAGASVASGFSRTETDRRTNQSVATTMDALKRGDRVSMTPTQFSINDSASTGRRLRLPRVGVYKSYFASMDEGWIRYVLEQFHVP